mmetsp:Transcript_28858/g.68842  ORF Transcript_28858/g.68842 Transcript_28858/m.68842 type:complete len:200 (+) Transcript_28858:470-1069(+)
MAPPCALLERMLPTTLPSPGCCHVPSSNGDRITWWGLALRVPPMPRRPSPARIPFFAATSSPPWYSGSPGARGGRARRGTGADTDEEEVSLTCASSSGSLRSKSCAPRPKMELISLPASRNAWLPDCPGVVDELLVSATESRMILCSAVDDIFSPLSWRGRMRVCTPSSGGRNENRLRAVSSIAGGAEFERSSRSCRFL